MERIKEVSKVEDTRIRWKKVGGGSFRWNRRIIKSGEVFLANVEDIPKGFRDQIIPLDSIKEKVATPIVAVKSVYEIKSRGKSKSLFDVVDGNGKVLNEKALSKEVADKLVKDLSK